ncbi:hypothetical protein V2J09_005751 [Rumex salicifolius]
MLVGRESLVRLIGKRRRFLPNRHRLLRLASNQSSKSNPCDLTSAVNDEPQAKHCQVVSPKEEENGDNPGLVDCPVCGKRVQSQDYTINAHLDACLTRGRKRKLTQLTLLQFNRYNIEHSATLDVDHIGDKLLKRIFTQQVAISAVVKDVNKNDCEMSESIQCEYSGSSDENQGVASFEFDSSYEQDDALDNKKSLTHEINYKNTDASTSPNVEMSSCSIESILDLVTESVLETYIVGRRFVEEVDLTSGLDIFLLRDPDNIKDSNAIKVVDAVSADHKALGFIPRDLAQYLSPMIDKYQMMFKGTITSVPERPTGPVSIRLKCQKIPCIGEIQHDKLQDFKSLWNNVLSSINTRIKSPPNFAKSQQNFCLVLDEVLSSNSHLFTNDEKCFLEAFNSLSDDAQRLFIRLYMRKGPWFQASKISYPEIEDSQKGILLLNVMTVTELREIQCVLKERFKVGMKKQDIIASLVLSYKGGIQLYRVALQKMGMCVRISLLAESLLWRVQRLFFLNGEQDLSAFLLADLGIVKYPEYKCSISDKVFYDRRELLAYEEAIEVAQIMDEALDAQIFEFAFQCIEISESYITGSYDKTPQSLMSRSSNSFLRCFTASWVYSKVILLGVSFMEYRCRYSDAIRLLKLLLSSFHCVGSRGYWTLRLSVDLEHIGLIDESLSVAEGGIRDPWVRSGSRMALQRRVIRLGKPPRRWKVPSFSQSVKRKIIEVQIQGRPLNSKTGMKSIFYGEDGEQCGVEQLALQYYAGEGGGWQGVHTETGIWLTIFGLLMWDIIFSDVPNVFQSKFQIAPLDLDTDDFYGARKNLIESHLQKIHDGMAEEILIMSWECHFGTSCRGINWERHSIEELRAAVTCIGGPRIASLCRHLAQDYRSWSRGMPDLLIWRFHGDYKGEAKLVEVKGPKDKLSEQQRAWLLALMDCGFSVEVCKVSPVLL